MSVLLLTAETITAELIAELIGDASYRDDRRTVADAYTALHGVTLRPATRRRSAVRTRKDPRYAEARARVAEVLNARRAALRERLAAVTTGLLRPGESPEAINTGRCEAWAQAASAAVGGVPVWVGDLVDVDAYPIDDQPRIGHCVLDLGGRYYDSEHLDGVPDVLLMDNVYGAERLNARHAAEVSRG